MIYKISTFLLFLLPFVVQANGYPIDEFESGVYIGEAIKSNAIAIEKEVLTLDLTSLPKNEIATVTANYNLVVDTLFDSLKIAFISHQLLDNQVTVSMDGKPISIQQIRVDSLPQFLTLPRFTPAFNAAHDSITYNMQLDSTGYVLFEIKDLTEGKHTLEVEYALKPAILHKDFGSLTRIWQISYALSPASYWKAFNALDVLVEIPKNWEAVSNVELVQEGNSLVGSFDKIPADDLLISARSKGETIYNNLYKLRILLYIIVGSLLFFALYKLAQNQYNKPKYVLKLGGFILITSLLLPLVWFFTELSIIPITNRLLDGQVNQNLLDLNGYGLTMYAIFFTPMIIITSIITQGVLAAIFYFRRKNKEP